MYHAIYCRTGLFAAEPASSLDEAQAFLREGRKAGTLDPIGIADDTGRAWIYPGEAEGEQSWSAVLDGIRSALELPPDAWLSLAGVLDLEMTRNPQARE